MEPAHHTPAAPRRSHPPAHHARIAIAATLCAALAGTLPGCGSGSGTPDTPVSPSPAPTISISPRASVAVGGSLTMTASSSAGGQITWTSDTPSIITVSSSGTITGVAPGDGIVRASSGGGSATATVVVLPPFVDLTVGRSHACARSAQNALYCWGDNGVAALGAATPEICPAQLRQCSTLPRNTVTTPSFVQLGASFGGVTCGLTAAGAAWCWGNNSGGEIGSTTETCTVEGVGTSSCARAPIAVPGGRSFTRLSLGGAACALTASDDAFCWGASSTGALGAANLPDTCAGIPCSRTPIAVAGTLKFTSLASGNEHTCGIAVGGQAYCWGSNAVGQLGSATPGGSVPALVSGGHAFVALAAFATQTCGIDVGGDAWCWGDNAFGQLGNNSTSASSLPVLVAGGRKYTAITAALEHTCALATDGAAWCWGQNTGLQVQGQLGNGTTTPSTVPVAVAGGHRFVQIAAGRQATCGRKATGLVYCWGDNRFGQLGIGNAELRNSLLPVGVAGAP